MTPALLRGEPSMTGSLLVGCLLALPPGAGAVPASAGAPSFSRDQIDALVARLRESGGQWMAGLPVDPPVERDLKATTFDEASAPVLAAALRAIRLRDPNGLYAADRLVRQVLMAKVGVVRGVLPAIKGIRESVKDDYQPFARYTGGQAAGTQPAGGKRPLTKLQRDQRVARHNELVGGLETRCFQAMLRAGDATDDELLVEWMGQAEHRGSGVFLDILSAISAGCARMDKDRAARLYDVLKRAGGKLRYQPARQYVHPARCKLAADAQSTFETTTAFAGVEIIAALNRVATAAKMPAIRPPTKKEIDGANKPKRRR